jgi:hypothetical protein
MKEITLKGEHWQDNLIGLSWNDRLKDAIAQKYLREIRLAKAELDLKTLDLGETPIQSTIECTFFTALKSPSKPKIEDIGFSIPEDMFTNNFGLWLAGFFQGANQLKPSGGQFTGINEANGGLSGLIYATYYSSYQYPFNNTTGMGTQFKIGSSNAAAARTQYAIQTAFGTAPESTRFPTGPGCYAVAGGVISFCGAITAGGSGTVNEVALFGNWYNGVEMLARDVLGGGVAFVAGNSLVATGAISI